MTLIAACNSYKNLYDTIPGSFEQFSTSQIQRKLSSINARVDDLALKIRSLSIKHSSSLEFLSLAHHDLPGQSLNRSRLSHLDLHASMPNQYFEVLNSRTERELITYLREAISFIISPLKLACRDPNPNEGSSNYLPTETKSLFHFLSCGRRIHYRQELGRGTYGQVVLATLDKLSFACKQICPINPEQYLPETSPGERHDISRGSLEIEAFILGKIRHPNIITLLGLGYIDNDPILYLELADKTLFTFFLELPVSPHNFRAIDSNLRLKIFTQLSLALEYLHNKEIIHKDLSARNILLTKKSNVKICDFGFTTLRNQEKSTILCADYAAPESILEGSISPKCDIWSLGILMFFAFKCRFPYPREFHEIQDSHGVVLYTINETDADYRQRLYNALYVRSIEINTLFQERKWNLYDPERFWRVLIERCLTGRPEARYSATEALLHLQRAPNSNPS